MARSSIAQITESASRRYVYLPRGLSLSPKPIMSTATTRCLSDSRETARRQSRREPVPPCKSTMGLPSEPVTEYATRLPSGKMAER